MGPGDPFSIHKQGKTEQKTAQSTMLDHIERLIKPDAPSSTRSFVLTGLLVGSALGILFLINMVLEGLFVFLCGIIGAGIAWIGHGIFTGRLDFGAAWRALRGS